MSAVTEIKVVVARMIPRSVRKLRSLLLLSESIAIRPASQQEALRRELRDLCSLGQKKLLQPVQHNSIKPKARPFTGQKAQMSAMLRCKQPQSRIALKGRVAVDRKRHQRIILGSDDERRHANRIQKTGGGLGGVIIRRRTKSKQRRGKFVIELPNGAHLLQSFYMIDMRRDLALSFHSFA